MLEGLHPNKPEYSCKIRTLLTTLEPEDAKILNEALLNPEWTANGLAKALSGRGLQVSGHVVSRHMKKECSCA